MQQLHCFATSARAGKVCCIIQRRMKNSTRPALCKSELSANHLIENPRGRQRRGHQRRIFRNSRGHHNGSTLRPRRNHAKTVAAAAKSWRIIGSDGSRRTAPPRILGASCPARTSSPAFPSRESKRGSRASRRPRFSLIPRAQTHRAAPFAPASVASPFPHHARPSHQPISVSDVPSSGCRPQKPIISEVSLCRSFQRQ